ncbi:hypothetical protein D915_002573 [Fasciola hepatica]|uniref:Uncharacterized protein n=1 Tax=Fasciola hepatica TaxID=6192 RepID=A0A4E0RXG0_FASHE|nr:hypothetical protein D915_002573 [Fasciola hepatica]
MWVGASSISLSLLDRLRRKAVRLIGDPPSTSVRSGKPYYAVPLVVRVRYSFTLCADHPSVTDASHNPNTITRALPSTIDEIGNAVSSEEVISMFCESVRVACTCNGQMATVLGSKSSDKQWYVKQINTFTLQSLADR